MLYARLHVVRRLRFARLQALECLVQLASVRRSIFSTDAERAKFLAYLVHAITDILRSQHGLADPSNFHGFCRLLVRMKVNYQLSELVSIDVYKDWIELVAHFSARSFHSPEWASNSVHYLLQFWQRLVASMPYLRGEGASYLDSCVPQVTKMYITSRLESVKICLGSSVVEDPLENDELLVEQLEALSPLGRFQYEQTAAFICSAYDPILDGLQKISSMQQVDASALQLAEAELTWLVHIIGAVVGGRLGSTRSEAHEVIDGDLCGRVFQTLNWIELRLASYHGVSDPLFGRLEIALLSFFQMFRRAYIGENAHVTSTKVFERLNEKLGLSDHPMVLRSMMTKIVSNLKYWAGNQTIVSRTLTLFFDLAMGYSSSRLLLKLDLINYVMEHHSPDYFPFLDMPCNTRHRTTFYTTLTKILLLDDSTANFDVFMEPFRPVLGQLAAISSNPALAADLKPLMIGIMRDFRGIVMGTTNRRAYTLFFDWFYPDFVGILVQAVQIWGNCQQVMIPLLKFVAELVFNKGQRLTFDCSSPNGILLFRETSKVLVTYGNAILATSVVSDAYMEKYKGVGICLAVLKNALSGSYVNFGVFALYGDTALSDALRMTLQMALTIPLSELMAYPKAYRAYFGFIEVLCHNHMNFIADLDTSIFVQIIESVYEGMRSVLH
jgi:exportin-7